MNTNAAETFIATSARIVETTGCSIDQAVNYLLRQMATERPELLGKVATAAAAKMAAA